MIDGVAAGHGPWRRIAPTTSCLIARAAAFLCPFPRALNASWFGVDRRVGLSVPVAFWQRPAVRRHFNRWASWTSLRTFWLRSRFPRGTCVRAFSVGLEVTRINRVAAFGPGAGQSYPLWPRWCAGTGTTATRGSRRPERVAARSGPGGHDLPASRRRRGGYRRETRRALEENFATND